MILMKVARLLLNKTKEGIALYVCFQIKPRGGEDIVTQHTGIVAGSAEGAAR
jgi:hypothetical protein